MNKKSLRRLAEGFVGYNEEYIKKGTVSFKDKLIFVKFEDGTEEVIEVFCRKVSANESKSFGYDFKNLMGLKETKYKGILKLAYFIVHEDDTAQLFLVSLDDMERLCADQEIHFANKVNGEYRIIITESEKTNHLSDIKQNGLIEFKEFKIIN